MTSASDEKWWPFNCFFQSREQVAVWRGQIRKIGWMIKPLEDQVGQFLLSCKCTVSWGIVMQEQDPLVTFPLRMYHLLLHAHTPCILTTKCIHVFLMIFTINTEQHHLAEHLQLQHIGDEWHSDDFQTWKRLNTVVTASTSGVYMVHASTALTTLSLWKDKLIHNVSFIITTSIMLHVHTQITTTSTSKWLNYKICHSRRMLSLHYPEQPLHPQWMHSTMRPWKWYINLLKPEFYI